MYHRVYFPTTNDVEKNLFNIHRTTMYIDKDESDNGYYVIDINKTPVNIMEYIEI